MPKTMTAETNRPTLNARHFDLLRLAKLRGLKVRRLGESLYAVTSHTRAGFEWVVGAGACSCPAKGYCTHLATAVDFHFTVEASPVDYGIYAGERSADRLTLAHRLRTGRLSRTDKTYYRACERYVRTKWARAEAAKASGVPAVSERVVREGGRVRTVTRVGAFVI